MGSFYSPDTKGLVDAESDEEFEAGLGWDWDGNDES